MDWEIEDDAPIMLHFAALDTGYAELVISNDEMIFDDKPLVVQFTSDPVSTASRHISGHILAEKTSIPLGGIKVYPVRVRKEDDLWRMWNFQFGGRPDSDYNIDDAGSVTSSDGDGAFKLGPLPPGQYDIKYGAPDLGDEPRHMSIIRGSIPINVSPDKDIGNLEIRYPSEGPSYSLSGKIMLGDTTRPFASTQVDIVVMTYYPPDLEPEHWRIWEPITRNITTDAQGNYKLYPFHPGKYKLEVICGKYKTTKIVAIRSNRNGVDFIMQ